MELDLWTAVMEARSGPVCKSEEQEVDAEAEEQGSSGTGSGPSGGPIQ